MKKLNEDELKAKLPEEKYKVLRQKATEPPFSGKLLNNHGSGDYICGACGATVFKSGAKFDSGSGWPSFNEPANKEAVMLVPDTSLGMERTEVLCANCGSHLGHLFNDAYDQPGGKRYCINSLALDFNKKG